MNLAGETKFIIAKEDFLPSCLTALPVLFSRA